MNPGGGEANKVGPTIAQLSLQSTGVGKGTPWGFSELRRYSLKLREAEAAEFQGRCLERKELYKKSAS